MIDNSLWGRRDILRFGAAAALGSVSIFGGCSPSGGPSSDPKSSLTSINIVNTASNNTFTLQEMLKQLGYLREFGVQATTVNVSDGSKLVGALLSGTSDICLLAGFGQVLPAIEKGGKLKILAGAGLLTVQSVYTARPDIQSVRDLAGKTVATGAPGALLHQLMVALLQKKGVDVKKVTFVNVGSSADVFRAVAAKTVDAGPSLTDVNVQLAKYGVHTLADGDFWEQLPEFTYQGSFSSDRAIVDKREGLVRTLGAYCKLYRFVQGPDSMDSFVRARMTALSENDSQAARSEWEFIQAHKPYAVDLLLSEERIRYMQKLNLDLGVQQNILPYEKVADMSLAQDALKLLHS